jgi:hypothetical protein
MDANSHASRAQRSSAALEPLIMYETKTDQATSTMTATANAPRGTEMLGYADV